MSGMHECCDCLWAAERDAIKAQLGAAHRRIAEYEAHWVREDQDQAALRAQLAEARALVAELHDALDAYRAHYYPPPKLRAPGSDTNDAIDDEVPVRDLLARAKRVVNGELTSKAFAGKSGPDDLGGGA